MVVWFAYPKPLAEAYAGTVLTFLVPAADGCNLKCSYCLITQRGEREARAPKLLPSDYADFVRDMCKFTDVACVAVQGDEPLLPASLPYTVQLLEAGRAAGVPTSIVTNGTHLADNVQLLTGLDLTYLAVSLDSASAAVHDKLRGVAGAFDMTVRGIRKVVEAGDLTDRLLVSSVLLPGKLAYLRGMAAFLASIGVKHWFLSPYVKIGVKELGGLMETEQELLVAFRTLQDEARDAGISISVCDDFNHLYTLRRKTTALRTLNFKTLGRPEGILRMLPSGACAVGEEILLRHSEACSVWVPNTERPVDFFLRIMQNKGRHSSTALA